MRTLDPDHHEDQHRQVISHGFCVDLNRQFDCAVWSPPAGVCQTVSTTYKDTHGLLWTYADYINAQNRLRSECHDAQVFKVFITTTPYLAGTQRWNNVDSTLIQCQDVKSTLIRRFNEGNVETMSIQRWFNVRTLNQRWFYVVSTKGTFKPCRFNVDLTSRRWINVDSTLFQRCVPAW